MFQIYDWQPTIGDPSIMGWVTVVAYFLTATLALTIYLDGKRLFQNPATQKMQRGFWFTVFLLMLILGINKQLDLQSLITAMGRYYANRDGWIEYKRQVQIAVIASILIIGALSLLAFAYRVRALFQTNWLAIFGLSCLLIFIAIRATSFHHMDIFINIEIYGSKVNWIMELGGIAAVFLSGFSIYRKSEIKNTG